MLFNNKADNMGENQHKMYCPFTQKFKVICISVPSKVIDHSTPFFSYPVSSQNQSVQAWLKIHVSQILQLIGESM